MDRLVAFMKVVEEAPNRTARAILDRVLGKARELTGAEAGAVFLVRRRGSQSWLEAVSVQNDRLKPRKVDLTVPLDTKTVSGYVASTGEIVSIGDVSDAKPGRGYAVDFGPDSPSGYDVRSVLCFPFSSFEGDVLGVIQLINRRIADSDVVVPFAPEHAELMRPIDHVVGRAVERAEMVGRIARQNARLRQQNRELEERRRQIAALQAQTEDALLLSIQLLAKAAEIYDDVTGNHIQRVNEYSYVLATHLGMPREFCDEIRYSAQLHDVGKMSVDAAVLKKRGSLTEDERAEMDRHPVYGYEILRQSPRLRMAADIALCHHEKWDGTGYPNRLKGEEIPIAARIVQIADVYDALRDARPYKNAIDHEQACQIMMSGDEKLNSVGHFDPRLLGVFAEHHAEFDRIWRELRD
ncbi:MAG: HD domain-containing protein [Alphaproteobacteria bacterium]|nr:HD domain-containing protein [Alphaproteobacteria bacterium]